MGAMKLAKTLVIVRGLITEALGLIFQKKKKKWLEFWREFWAFWFNNNNNGDGFCHLRQLYANIKILLSRWRMENTAFKQLFSQRI